MLGKMENELRPCIVTFKDDSGSYEEKALLHGFFISYFVRQGVNGEYQRTNALALVEFDDGAMETVLGVNVRMLDGKDKFKELFK